MSDTNGISSTGWPGSLAHRQQFQHLHHPQPQSAQSASSSAHPGLPAVTGLPGPEQPQPHSSHRVPGAGLQHTQTGQPPQDQGYVEPPSPTQVHVLQIPVLRGKRGGDQWAKIVTLTARILGVDRWLTTPHALPDPAMAREEIQLSYLLLLMEASLSHTVKQKLVDRGYDDMHHGGKQLFDHVVSWADVRWLPVGYIPDPGVPRPRRVRGRGVPRRLVRGATGRVRRLLRR
jgi:hypothetical protein